jgi:hypothetical protein
MAPVTGSNPNLMNGESRQPPSVRLATQLEEQINAFSTPTRGLQKRPPSHHVKTLSGTFSGDIFTHHINRDSSERYHVLLVDRDIKVWDINGTEKTVNLETITKTSLSGSTDVGNGDSFQVILRIGDTALSVVTTGISGDTVLVQESTTGAFGGEETTAATITTNTTTAVTATSGRYYRCRQSVNGSGTVTATMAWKSAAYLDVTTPSEEFQAVTSADYTFIANKNVMVAMDGDNIAPTRGEEALVFVRAANYSRRYDIYINDTLVAGYTTPDGVDDTRASQLKEQKTVTPINLARILFWGNTVSGTVGGWTTTDGGYVDADFSGDSTAGESVIHERLVDNLSASDWQVTRYANVLHIKRIDGTPFTIRTESDRPSNADALISIKDRIQDFTDLPNHGPEGYVVQVSGTPTDGFDNYWVRLTKPDAADGNDSVVWEECPEPGVEVGFDAETMPHILVRENDGTFTFKRATWVDRKVGGEEDDPPPSFVGTEVQDVFFHRGRLGFVGNESIILTRPAEFFDFWRTTVTAVLDDDPIDIAGTDNTVSIFEHGATFNEELFLFSGLTAHKLTTGDILSPKTVALDPVLAEPINLSCPPVSTTKSLFYFSALTKYADLREILVITDLDQLEAQSVADHVPGYLPLTMSRLISSPTANALLCLNSTNKNRIYVYQYFWVGQEKVQSAWHYWEFDSAAEVIGGRFFDDEAHLMIRRGTTLYLEKIPCISYMADTSQEWMVRLDRRVTDDSLGVYDSEDDETTFTLPYDIASSTDYIAVYGPSEGTSFGVELTITARGSNTITVEGDHSDTEVIIGRKYTMTCTLSQLMIRQQHNEGSVPIQSRRFQVLRMYFHTTDTAYYKVQVTPFAGSQVYTTTYSPFEVGQAGSLADQVVIRDDAMSVPIKAKNDRVTISLINDTHHPVSFTGIEWEGHYVPRATRIG